MVRGRSWGFEFLLDLLLSQDLGKADLGVQFGPFHTQPVLAEEATSCGSLIAPNRVLRTCHKQYLTLACTIGPPIRPKTNTWWPHSDNNRAESIKLHKQFIHREIFSESKPGWGEFCVMCYACCLSLTVSQPDKPTQKSANSNWDSTIQLQKTKQNKKFPSPSWETAERN